MAVACRGLSFLLGHSFTVFRERIAGSGQMIWMMVAVALQQHLDRHA
jgi:hypothetical protein